MVDKYPLPKPEDLMSNLAGGLRFSKLDLNQAYLQIVLDKDSRKYVTVNTHKGLYQYKKGTLWNSHCPSPIPTQHGYNSARNTKYYL